MPALMIFAAGFGTRMRPLTDDRPKPLVEVGGRTLLDRALEMGAEAGAAPVVVNTHYLGAQVADHLAGRDVAISPEPDLILDTGGGLRRALPMLGAGPVMTLNPDVVWSGPNVLKALQAAWDGDRMDALLALVPVARATARKGAGDFAMDDAGRIARQGDHVYAGAQIIRPEALHDIPDQVFSLNLLWDRMIADGRAFGMVHPGGWCDVGYPEAIPMAEALLDA
ncbi:nucleotidyltransferase family protein [Paracoccus sp. 1_MG-2023]|uniref:nucleotidyltransferase family protein n=1 Tax=unclassified Paracoccus (in: a-proteobacteria) TaxID=2688777 RepID=UPI001C082902|nr:MULTISPECIES: nucleotidyltransferase family protein [unclassified Paracoccus (in: a-proteobacteria)]MBU2957188.1 nucleotidyltransferase family protein [Paracoccus sp. C2R09]MDO6669075.1 nucleotidyltransferase family protein [Paracoccus sp. 1_MG-2023]